MSCNSHVDYNSSNQLLINGSDQQSGILWHLQSLKQANAQLDHAHRGKLDAIITSLGKIQEDASRSWNEPEDADADIFGKPLVSESFHYLAHNLRSIISTSKRVAVEQVILKSLHYKAMAVRVGNVAEAYNNTFEWIFKPRSAAKKGRPDVNFSEWLASGDGVYWISGKPGSGKSTLMKFLCSHPTTSEKLTQWAAPREVVVSSHFFWISGTPIQKSQEGLFRSLLYEIFKKCPRVAREVCPDRWKLAETDQDNEPWTLQQLKIALTKVSQCDDLGIKLCIFVDGLDEYDGDHLDIINLFNTLASSTVIKLCLSSRPWNVFEDAFGKRPRHKLYLQDLTHNDIRRYVVQKLGDHPNWNFLVYDTPQLADLVEGVTKKAQGVFLWIYLVVRSLSEGLTNGDSILTLKERVKRLPADLEGFFKHILSSVDSIYHGQMVQTFRVAMAAPAPLPLMLYSLLDELMENDKLPLNSFNSQMPTKEIDRRHEQIKRRLNGRCKGLLEVCKNDDQVHILSYQVDFLHRTVRDFLRTKEMYDFLKIDDATKKPNSSILKSYVTLIKRLPMEQEYMESEGLLQGLLKDTFYFAGQAETESQCSHVELLDDLQDTLQVYSSTTSRRIPWYPGCYSTRRTHPGNPPCGTFLEFSIQKGLCLYVKDKLRPNRCLLQVKQPLLDCALILCPTNTLDEPDMVGMVHILLDYGYDPNEFSQGHTPWLLFLEDYARDLGTPGSGTLCSKQILHRHRLIELLLARGADPNVLNIYGEDSWRYLILNALGNEQLSSGSCETLLETYSLAISTSLGKRRWCGVDATWLVLCSMMKQHFYKDQPPEKLEFLSKVMCLLLSNGVSPDSALELPPETLSSILPAGLARPVLKHLKQPTERKASKEMQKIGPFSWISWVWPYSKPTDRRHEGAPQATLKPPSTPSQAKETIERKLREPYGELDRHPPWSR